MLNLANPVQSKYLKCVAEFSCTLICLCSEKLGLQNVIIQENHLLEHYIPELKYQAQYQEKSFSMNLKSFVAESVYVHG